MGITISVTNNSNYDPVKGEVIMLGGGKLPPGWSFELSPGETFTNTDNGVSASCPYDLILYVPNYSESNSPPFGSFGVDQDWGKHFKEMKDNMKIIKHRFKAPSARGTHLINVNTVIAESIKRQDEAFRRKTRSRSHSAGRKHLHPHNRITNAHHQDITSPPPDGRSLSHSPRRTAASMDYNGTESPNGLSPKAQKMLGVGEFTMTEVRTRGGSGGGSPISGGRTSPPSPGAGFNTHNSKLRSPRQQEDTKGIKKGKSNWVQELNERRERLRMERESVLYWMLADFWQWVVENPHSFCIYLGMILLLGPPLVTFVSGASPGLVALLLMGIVALAHPAFFGWVMTIALRYTALNGFRMDFGAIHLWPSVNILSGRLSLSVLAEDVGFGNPPDFPHKYFVKCARVSLRLSAKIRDLFGMYRWGRTPWSPFPSECVDQVGRKGTPHFQEGEIRMRVEGLNLLPPGFSRAGHCYFKIKMGDKGIYKSEIRTITPDKKSDVRWHEICIPYAHVKHDHILTFTIWDRLEGAVTKTFLGEISLTVEDIKACGKGRSHLLKDKRGGIFSESWRKKIGREPDGHGQLELRISADLEGSDASHWGGLWESKDFLRPYVIVYDNGTEIARTEQKERTDTPAWKPIILDMKKMSATSNLTFDVWSNDDVAKHGQPLGSSEASLIRLASSRHSVHLPITIPASPTTKPFIRQRGGSVDFYDDDLVLPQSTSPKSPKRKGKGHSKPHITIKTRKRGGFRLPQDCWDGSFATAGQIRISDVQATQLAAKPAFLGTVDIEHIEFDTVMLNFETHRGEFNVNGVTRMIAEGEMARAITRTLEPAFTWPNCLEVRLIRARNLRTQNGHVPSPKIVMMIRKQRASSLGHHLNASPLFDERFRFVVTDPSAVLHVQVQNQGLVSGSLIGHWVMTLKWLFVSPGFCQHNPGLKTWLTDDTLPPGAIRGWFPLLDSEFRHRHSCGEIEMQVQWTFVDGYDKDYHPPRSRALDQLTENSNETKLRLGDMNAVNEMLHRFPLMVRVGRVTIRRVSFFLKDLFLGYRGAAEKKGAKEEALYVDFLESKGSGPVLEEITQNEVKYMEKHGHKHQLAIDKQRVAHTLKTFLEAWVKSLVPQVVKKGGLVGSATSQIIGSMFSSFFDFGGGGKGKKTLGTETVDGRVKKASMLVRVGRQLAAKIVAKKTWNNRLVTAHDTDYFLPVIIKGITEKRTSRLKKWVHAFMELKGNTLFYADCDKHTGKKLHPEKKLDLSQATEVKLLNVPHKEIFIQTAGRSRWIRIPVEVPGPSIKQWFEEIRNHQRRNLRGMIRVHLVECKGLPSHGHIHIGVHMHISAKIAGASGEEHDIPPVRSKTHRISSNPNWGDEELVVGPLTPDSKVLILNLHYSRHRTANARIELPLTAITGETQNFSLPWTPPDPKRDAKTKPPENPGGDTKEPATVKSPRNSTASKSRGKSNAGVGMGTLVFKAQRSERVIRYKHQLYMAPSSHEGSAKNLTPLDNNLQDSLKPNLGGSLNSASSPGKRNSITSSLGDPPRKQPADSDDWNSHDLMSLMSTLKGDTAMVLRELDEKNHQIIIPPLLHQPDPKAPAYPPPAYPPRILPIQSKENTEASPRQLRPKSPRERGTTEGGGTPEGGGTTGRYYRNRSNTQGTVMSVDSDAIGDYGETKGNLTRRTSIDSVDPILLEAPSAQPPKPPTTRAPTTSPNMHPRRRRSTVDEEKDLDDLQSIATDFTETTYGGSMATINRGSIVGPSPFDTGFYDKVMTKYMVYKIGPLGRKHLREIAIGESHFFTRRPTGKGKAKHGKIPFSNIVDVKLLKKKGPEYFEINFSGSVMKGRRRYIAQTPEQAMQIVSKLTAVSQKHKEKDVKEESTRR